MSPPTVELERDGQVALLWLDQPGTEVNMLSPPWLDALGSALDEVQGDRGLRAAVLISRKPDSFVVGADLDLLRELRAPSEALELSGRAQGLVARLAGLSKPVVAAVHGPALGAGLELALGCAYRLATDHPKTALGLPEVRLGLTPGAGGTQYLPRLIGLARSLRPLLTGRKIRPRQARHLGLVDALIHAPGLRDAAVRAARGLTDGTLCAERSGEPVTNRLLDGNPVGRRLVYRRAREQVERETRGNLPAPTRILECVRTGLEEGLGAGLAVEARAFAQLLFTSEHRALTGLFLDQRESRKNPRASQARPVARVAVLGAGLMGAGIAEVSVRSGLDVVIKDRDLGLSARSRKLLWESLGRSVDRGALSPFQRDRILERLIPTAAYEGLARADLVVEAVPEDLELKREVLAAAEAATGPESVLASNTSSIPLAELAPALKKPEKLLGMHYFSPVPRVPLLEVVRGESTAEWALATAVETGLRQGKAVIVVGDGPGFYTTRALALYLNEALLCLGEGAGIAAVDQAMVDFGFPLGPFALLDEVGLDVGAKVTGVLEPAFSARGVEVSRALGPLVEAGLRGRKGGAGFYRYPSGRRGRGKVNDAVYELAGAGRTELASSNVEERLSLALVGEALRCLEDGVLRSPRDGDVGAVLGLGFPPFLGGPFRYVDRRGPAAVTAWLHQLAERYGPRFHPPRILQDLAGRGGRFRER